MRKGIDPLIFKVNYRKKLQTFPCKFMFQAIVKLPNLTYLRRDDKESRISLQRK